MLADLKPDRAAVIWDSGLPERRVALQPDYKQNREEMPAELRPQGDWLETNVPLFGPSSLSREGTEADDLIASYARAAEADGAEVVIATNDKDILQLASDRIRIYTTNKAEAGESGYALLGVDEVRRKWGVEPGQIADVLALTGDASDNIPGVAGVGPKTAVALIREHGSVERVLADPSVIANEKLRSKIEAARRQIMDNREMVRLDDDLALERPWRDLTIEPRYPELIAALRACEFRGLVAEVEREADIAARRGQGDLFGFTG